MKLIDKLIPKSRHINPAEYGISLGQPAIDSIESVVYKGENKGREIVLKVYNMNRIISHHKLTLEELKFYQEITRKVKNRFDGHQITLPPKGISYELEIVPIDIVGKIRQHYLGSISNFIPGKTLPLRGDEEYREDIATKLVEMSSEINKFLWSGFYIHPINVKLQMSEVNKFIITDICHQIPKLQSFYQNSKYL